MIIKIKGNKRGEGTKPSSLNLDALAGVPPIYGHVDWLVPARILWLFSKPPIYRNRSPSPDNVVGKGVGVACRHARREMLDSFLDEGSGAERVGARLKRDADAGAGMAVGADRCGIAFGT